MHSPSHVFNTLRARGERNSKIEKEKTLCKSKALHSCLVMSVFMLHLKYKEASCLPRPLMNGSKRTRVNDNPCASCRTWRILYKYTPIYDAYFHQSIFWPKSLLRIDELILITLQSQSRFWHWFSLKLLTYG